MALRCGAIGPAGIPRDVQTHGAIRNLDCEYCFFLSKDELYPGNGFRMDAEVHEAYVGQLLAGLEFFRTTLELQQEYVEPGQGVLNTLQRPTVH